MNALNKKHPIVLTLDAGGTNFVFTAIQDYQEIIAPIVLSAHSDDLNQCLNTLLTGFELAKNKLNEDPVAISFAFPGPADYENGIMGDLPNFSSFRDGVALGPLLKEKFNIPVFINNDGNLFAYGEALAGFLPEVNRKLKEAGSLREYKNLIGITLGTGFGAGVVINQTLLTGDNGAGGDMWIFRNAKYPGMIAEESVSIRAVKRVYEELSSESAGSLTPKDIFEIAEGIKPGNQKAAINSFNELGEQAGAALSYALNIVDGIVVIGGGISGAAKYIIPSVIQELQKPLNTFAGQSYKGTQTDVYNFTDPTQFQIFLKDTGKWIDIPGSTKRQYYNTQKSTGIAVSKLGTSKAVSLGAYAFALTHI